MTAALKYFFRMLAIVLCIASVSVASARDRRSEVTLASPKTITQAGNYTYSISHQGLTRAYTIHVPENYKSPSPLVMAFHGGGGSKEALAHDALYGLISKSEKEGFVIVFPNGYSKFKSGKLATWNAGNCCGDARDRNIDDVGFIKKVVRDVSRRLPVDQKKIFATGISNGGMMAYRLACETNGLFAAIAAVAGTDNTKTCSPTRPMPVLHIHARNDDHVLYNGGAGPGAFRDIAKVTEFTSVPETIRRWTKHNHCNATPKQVLKVAGATCQSYQGCANGAEVRLCSTDKGAHSWPGGRKPHGTEPPSQAISANNLIWDFFTQKR